MTEHFNAKSKQELIDMPYEQLIAMINSLSTDEIIDLSNKIGYPVFTRLCMGVLRHKFVLLQDGAAAIIINSDDEILMQRRTDNDKWGLPGGCQELGETFEKTVIREVFEETGLIIIEENLELIAAVSGDNRRRSYPNGDVVINNTMLYEVRNYNGELNWNEESKEMQFFDIRNIPNNQHDEDLIDHYLKYKKNKQ